MWLPSSPCHFRYKNVWHWAAPTDTLRSPPPATGTATPQHKAARLAQARHVSSARHRGRPAERSPPAGEAPGGSPHPQAASGLRRPRPGSPVCSEATAPAPRSRQPWYQRTLGSAQGAAAAQQAAAPPPAVPNSVTADRGALGSVSPRHCVPLSLSSERSLVLCRGEGTASAQRSGRGAGTPGQSPRLAGGVPNALCPPPVSAAIAAPPTPAPAHSAPVSPGTAAPEKAGSAAGLGQRRRPSPLPATKHGRAARP